MRNESFLLGTKGKVGILGVSLKIFTGHTRWVVSRRKSKLEA